MRQAFFPPHDGLLTGSRFGRLARDHSRLLDFLLLGGMGIVAGLAEAMLDFSLRIPGHAIIRAAIPMAVGLALAPRNGGGTLLSWVGGLTVYLMSLAGRHGGAGAMTSLLLTGPLLDLAVCWARRGWQVYLGFIAAGLASNMVAFGVKWTSKVATGGGGRLDLWWSRAVVSYPLCGLLVGLLCAIVWFRATAGRSPRPKAQP